MALKYYLKNQAEQFAFIRIPRAMMTEEIFSSLSVEAKVLYGLLLDMISYSSEDRGIDEKNRIFVIYPVCQIQEDLGISKGKALECLQELEDIGLIDRQQRGQGMPICIYVKSFVAEKTERGI